MVLRALLFIGTLLLVLGGTGFYLARRSNALLPFLGRHPWLAYALFSLFVLLMFTVPLAHRLAPALDPVLPPFYAVGYFLFSVISTYLVYLLVADLAQFMTRKLLGVPPAFGTWAAGTALVLALLSALGGLVTALRPPVIRRVEVPISDLPPALEGFRIVQISDLHLGPLVRGAAVDRVVEATRSLQPDLVAVTGDLVDGEADGVKALAMRMKALEATHGVFFVTGNHEYYSGVATWLQVVRTMGWTVLANEHRVLDHRGAALAVAGLPDPTEGARRGGAAPDLAKALAGVPPEAIRLLLFHPPKGVEAAAAAGVHLQLSGHTHAGQYFPWSLVVRRIWQHPEGLHRSGNLRIYTSRGTGFWGPPNRLFVPSELTLLVLTRG